MIDRPVWNAVSVMPTLDVPNLAEAVDYYEGLGFRESWQYPSGDSSGYDGVTHVGMAFGDTQIMLALAARASQRVDRQNLYFVMTDIRPYHAQIAKRLGPTVPDLVESDYGMLDFSLADPWGHRLSFGEEC